MLSAGVGAALAFGCPGADQIALHVGKASEYREHQASGAGAGVGLRFRQGSERRLGVHDSLDDAEGLRASRSILVTLITSLGPACRACG
jgi:hypothetical protein